MAPTSTFTASSCLGPPGHAPYSRKMGGMAETAILNSSRKQNATSVFVFVSLTNERMAAALYVCGIGHS